MKTYNVRVSVEVWLNGEVTRPDIVVEVVADTHAEAARIFTAGCQRMVGSVQRQAARFIPTGKDGEFCQWCGVFFTPEALMQHECTGAPPVKGATA